jgi:hypothetical protein
MDDTALRVDHAWCWVPLHAVLGRRPVWAIAPRARSTSSTEYRQRCLEPAP